MSHHVIDGLKLLLETGERGDVSSERSLLGPADAAQINFTSIHLVTMLLLLSNTFYAGVFLLQRLFSSV